MEYFCLYTSPEVICWGYLASLFGVKIARNVWTEKETDESK